MELIDSQFPLLTAFAARVHVAPLPAGSIASKPAVYALFALSQSSPTRIRERAISYAKDRIAHCHGEIRLRPCRGFPVPPVLFARSAL
jgi:hypothetical protein